MGVIDTLIRRFKPPLHSIILLTTGGIESCLGKALRYCLAGIDALRVKTGFMNAEPSTGIDSS